MEVEAENESIPVASSPDAFAAVFGLVSLVADAKACGARLRDLQEREAAARKAEADLAVARDAHDRHVAELTASLDKRETAVDQRERVAIERDAELDAKQERVQQLLPNYREIDRQMRWRILHHALALEGFNERLQDLPDWDQIDRILGKPTDPHFSDGQPGVAEPDPDRVNPADTFQPPPGVTVTRSRSLPKSAAGRRSLRRAAEIN